MEIKASSFKLRANAPKGQKRFPISSGNVKTAVDPMGLNKSVEELEAKLLMILGYQARGGNIPSVSSKFPPANYDKMSKCNKASWLAAKLKDVYIGTITSYGWRDWTAPKSSKRWDPEVWNKNGKSIDDNTARGVGNHENPLTTNSIAICPPSYPFISGMGPTTKNTQITLIIESPSGEISTIVRDIDDRTGEYVGTLDKIEAGTGGKYTSGKLAGQLKVPKDIEPDSNQRLVFDLCRYGTSTKSQYDGYKVLAAFI